MNPYVTHTEEEKLIYVDEQNNSNVFNPHYSTEKAYDLFEDIIKDFCSDKKLYDKMWINGYNLFSTVFEELYWNYCFQYVKYKNFIDKYGIRHHIKKTNKGWQIDGLDRVQSYLKGPSKNPVKAVLKEKYKFIRWILRSYIYNKIKKERRVVWVESYLINNFRFDLLPDIIDPNNLLFINKLLPPNRKPANTINNAIVEEVRKKNKNYRWWLFAIRVLRPKRIIVNDNLYDDYALLLAAKIAGVETIGVSHGMVSKYHRGQFGSRHVSRDKLLKFDRFYVWDKEFRKLYVKEGHIYQAGEVKICGFLHKKHYPQIKTRKSKKLVLYPFEHFADYDAMLQLLKWFEKRSYRILIKSRPDMKNYGHFPGLDFQLVEDFTQDHFENALCIVGSTTTMLFDLSVIGLPVVLPKNNGLKMLSGISLPNWVYFDKGVSIEKISKLYSHYELQPVSSEFKAEFLA